MAIKGSRRTSDDLTAKQRRLVHELEEIASLLKIDYQDIRSYERAARTPVLEMMRRKFIISEVITSYTLTDEHLNVVICHYFFGRKENPGHPQTRPSKKWVSTFFWSVLHLAWQRASLTDLVGSGD
jgi:hypothetical protein